MLKVKTDITHEVVWNLLWSLERICLSLCLKPKESWNFEDNYSLKPKNVVFSNLVTLNLSKTCLSNWLIFLSVVLRWIERLLKRPLIYITHIDMNWSEKWNLTMYVTSLMILNWKMKQWWNNSDETEMKMPIFKCFVKLCKNLCLDVKSFGGCFSEFLCF